MNGWHLALMSAVWFGLLTSISPCPLATNIAAVSFLSRKVGSIRSVLAAGFLYTMGRCLVYLVLGYALVRGIAAAPMLSHVLQKYMNLLMGPLLVLVSMILLDLLKFPVGGKGIGPWMRKRLHQWVPLGALFLGIFFALSFCPTSAAFFFGSLIPLAVTYQSGILFPSLFGMATALPVLVFAFLLVFGANRMGMVYQKVARFEFWAQRITGVLFLVVGIGMTITQTLGISLR